MARELIDRRALKAIERERLRAACEKLNGLAGQSPGVEFPAQLAKLQAVLDTPTVGKGVRGMRLLPGRSLSGPGRSLVQNNYVCSSFFNIHCNRPPARQEPLEVTSPEAIIVAAVSEDDQEFPAQCKLVRKRCQEGPAERARMVQEVSF